MNRPKPEDNKLFERMIRDYIPIEYPQYNHFSLYGKNGERQYGCDALNQGRQLIIQCKCFDNYNPKSYDKLIGNIEEDYAKAMKHFPSMERFVVCTTLDRKRSTQDKIFAFQKTVPIDIWFWDDFVKIPGIMLPTNNEYAAAFEEALFLHRDNPNVCLKNLFVIQKYKELGSSRFDRDDLWKRIGDYIADTKRKLLILEGDAGCGKTSLIQALNWHDREGDSIAKDILDGRPLVTVRLRDLKSRINETNCLIEPIMDYLEITANPNYDRRKDELKRRFPRAVLVLEGFDELCILNGIREHEELLYRLTRERLDDWRFIVTCRPNYIHNSIDIPHTILALQHFDREKRESWIRQFTSEYLCAQQLDPELCSFILDNDSDGVCDNPLTLYLLASGNLQREDRNNLWKLYYRLFSVEIAERQYDSADHPGAQFKDIVYQIAEEISYRMYSENNERLFLKNEEIQQVVTGLKQSGVRQYIGDESSIEVLIKRSTALSCFWKVSEQRGAVEFYHNNIRDFFLCEKIYSGLNEIYHNERLSNIDKVAAVIAFFRDGFRIGAPEPQVCRFIYLRAERDKKEGEASFPALELEKQILPQCMQKLLADGRVYNNLNEKYLVPTILDIIACVVLVYRAALEPFREEKRLAWWTDVNEVNDAGLIRMVFEEIFSSYHLWAPWSEPGTNGAFAGVNLEAAQLESANFSGSDFSGACFQEANLQKADMVETLLIGSNLEGAHFQWADLSGAVLTCTNEETTCCRALEQNKLGRITDSTIRWTTKTMFYKADFSNAKLNNAVLSGSNLRGTNFEWANLDGADLSNTDFRGARLDNAKLPTDFSLEDLVEGQ